MHCVKEKKKISCRMARIWEGTVKGGPTLDDLLASLDSSAVEWRTRPEMNMDEMNERSNAKSFSSSFSRLLEQSTLLSVTCSRQRVLCLFRVQCLYRKPFCSGSCLDSREGKVVLSSLH